MDLVFQVLGLLCTLFTSLPCCSTLSLHATDILALPSFALTDPARPFDFLIDGELLRKTLEQHLLEHNISAVSLSVM